MCENFIPLYRTVENFGNVVGVEPKRPDLIVGHTEVDQICFGCVDDRDVPQLILTVLKNGLE